MKGDSYQYTAKGCLLCLLFTLSHMKASMESLAANESMQFEHIIRQIDRYLDIFRLPC